MIPYIFSDDEEDDAGLVRDLHDDIDDNQSSSSDSTSSSSPSCILAAELGWSSTPHIFLSYAKPSQQQQQVPSISTSKSSPPSSKVATTVVSIDISKRPECIAAVKFGDGEEVVKDRSSSTLTTAALTTEIDGQNESNDEEWENQEIFTKDEQSPIPPATSKSMHESRNLSIVKETNEDEMTRSTQAGQDTCEDESASFILNRRRQLNQQQQQQTDLQQEIDPHQEMRLFRLDESPVPVFEVAGDSFEKIVHKDDEVNHSSSPSHDKSSNEEYYAEHIRSLEEQCAKQKYEIAYLRAVVNELLLTTPIDQDQQPPPSNTDDHHRNHRARNKQSHHGKSKDAKNKSGIPTEIIFCQPNRLPATDNTDNNTNHHNNKAVDIIQAVINPDHHQHHEQHNKDEISQITPSIGDFEFQLPIGSSLNGGCDNNNKQYAFNLHTATLLARHNHSDTHDDDDDGYNPPALTNPNIHTGNAGVRTHPPSSQKQQQQQPPIDINCKPCANDALPKVNMQSSSCLQGKQPSHPQKFQTKTTDNSPMVSPSTSYDATTELTGPASTMVVRGVDLILYIPATVVEESNDDVVVETDNLIITNNIVMKKTFVKGRYTGRINGETGLPHGHGVFRFEHNHGYYTGSFSNGKFHGNGSLLLVTNTHERTHDGHHNEDTNNRSLINAKTNKKTMRRLKGVFRMNEFIGNSPPSQVSI